jgi:hypothetical protein
MAARRARHRHLHGRRLPKRRLGASTGGEDASTLGHCQAGQTKHPPDARGHFERPCSVRRDASETHILIRFASQRTTLSLYRPLKMVPDIFRTTRGRNDALFPFFSLGLVPLFNACFYFLRTHDREISL